MGKTELYKRIKFLRIFSVSDDDDDDSDFFFIFFLSSNMCGTWQSENGMCLSTKNLYDPQKPITGNGRVAQFSQPMWNRWAQWATLQYLTY